MSPRADVSYKRLFVNLKVLGQGDLFIHYSLYSMVYSAMMQIRTEFTFVR